ncbi:hypothetical protein LSAT2_009466, partial [Lamellibrachia satsuma]
METEGADDVTSEILPQVSVDGALVQSEHNTVRADSPSVGPPSDCVDSPAAAAGDCEDLSSHQCEDKLDGTEIIRPLDTTGSPLMPEQELEATAAGGKSEKFELDRCRRSSIEERRCWVVEDAVVTQVLDVDNVSQTADTCLTECCSSTGNAKDMCLSSESTREQRHLSVKTTEKCTEETTQQSDLRIVGIFNKRTATFALPYRCTMCDKSFRSS